MSVRFGVVVFPGSNCDADTVYALSAILGAETVTLWHRDATVKGVDCVVVPGGFAYGDYLRAGAIARFSPVMSAVQAHAASGGLVLGICNGFQVLVEAGLLPGALLRNRALEFRCRWTDLRVERADTPFTAAYAVGETIRLPVAHGEGCYYADGATLERLEANRQVVLRYAPSPPSHAAWSLGSAEPTAQPALPAAGEGSRQPSRPVPFPAAGKGSRYAFSPSPTVRERRAGPAIPRVGIGGPVSHGVGGEGSRGEGREGYNPNGSLHDIAGIVNEAGNVCGLMPHPERACEAIVGGTDGLRLFGSVIAALARVPA